MESLTTLDALTLPNIRERLPPTSSGLEAVSPMFTKREGNICVNCLDAVGGMDGKISSGDLEVGMKRARGDGPTLLDEFEAGKDKFYIERPAVPEKVTEKLLLEKVEEKDREEKEKPEVEVVEAAPLAVRMDPVSVVVPSSSTSTSFSDRYKVLVLEPSALSTKKKVIYTEPTSISGEVLMLRFSKESSGGISVEGLAGEGVKEGFFEVEAIKARGYGDIEGKSDLELAEVCKNMAGGMGIENGSMVLMQLR